MKNRWRGMLGRAKRHVNVGVVAVVDDSDFSEARLPPIAGGSQGRMSPLGSQS